MTVLPIRKILINPGDCKFKHADHHITDADLSRHYGDRFRMFGKEDEARAFAATLNNAWVSRIVDYATGDVEKVFESRGEGKKPRFVGLCIREGAKKVTKGWLVSMVGRPLARAA